MKTGTKIGLVLIALSIVLSIWVIVGGSSDANHQEGDFIIDDDGTAIQYVGSGGPVTIPDGVVALDVGLFKNNPNITSISMTNSVTTLGQDVCAGCEQLISVELSSNVTTIPANAFMGCDSLGSIDLSNITSIGSQAFYGCGSLTSVAIPAGCGTIGDSAFANCDNLSEITVRSGNPSYTSYSGCLYNANTSRLILVPGGKEQVDIPDSCTEIGANALDDATGVKEILIPATVTSIGDQGSWSPSVIYGYADTAAETYAKNNSIPFVIVGPGPGPEPTPPGPEPEPTPTPDPEPTPYVPTPGDVVNPDGTVTRADGTVVDPTTGRVIRGGTGATGSSHTKDATPGTADGDLDPRYFLCIAVFLGGAGCIVYARHRKTKYIKNKK